MKRVTLVALMILTACGSSGTTPSTSSSPSPRARPSSTGKITILSPTDGQSVTGSVVHLKVSLIGAHIVPLTTKNIRPDEGHLHVKLDGQLKTLTAGLQLDIPGVKPGAHVIEVEFVGSDHVPFDPRDAVGVSFVVK